MNAPTVTEREMVEAQRAAVMATTQEMSKLSGGAHNLTAYINDWEGSLSLAARLFPLPKVTRPRVATDEYGCEWRLVRGAVEWRGLGQDWGDKLAREQVSLTITLRRAEIIASLVANPTEEVDE